ncbi:tyrosine-type recombinase/integrase [Thermodesulfobacteriota bacterium]
MDLEHISVENNEFPQDFLQINPNKTESDQQYYTEPNPSLSERVQHEVSNPQIAWILQRISSKGLCGIDHIREYLVSLHRGNCRPNTIRTYSCTIILFLSFLKNIGIDQLETITREEFSSFIEHEQDRGLMPKTVSTRLRGLIAFFRFLSEREIISPNVLKHRMRVKVPDSLPRAIDPEDVLQLLSVIKKPRDRAMILVLLRTGMRIGELLNTTLKDINLKEKRIEIYEAQKNWEGRVVYISDDAGAALKIWLAYRKSEGPYLFYGRGGRPLCYEAARDLFCKYLEKAGLSYKGYTLHCLRHTFASELLNASMRLECLQMLLGHKSIEMTRRYARLTDNTRKTEYFRAMTIIESGGINGHYRCHHPLS